MVIIHANSIIIFMVVIDTLKGQMLSGETLAGLRSGPVCKVQQGQLQSPAPGESPVSAQSGQGRD